jgi:hypothetical protein
MHLSTPNLFYSQRILIVLLVFASLVTYAQSFTVSAKKHGLAIPVNKSFDWYVELDDTLKYASYLYDTQLRSDLKKAITNELQNLGYSEDPVYPGLLVKFYVFNSPSRLYGFDRFNSSLKNLIGTSAKSDKADYNVLPGTLLVSLVHPATNKIIWEGFASGLIDSQAVKKNSLMVKEAVRLVFQEYAYQIQSSAIHLD